MLLDIAFGIVECYVHDVAFCIIMRGVNRVYETFVWSQVEFRVALQDLFVQGWEEDLLNRLQLDILRQDEA